MNIIGSSDKLDGTILVIITSYDVVMYNLHALNVDFLQNFVLPLSKIFLFRSIFEIKFLSSLKLWTNSTICIFCINIYMLGIFSIYLSRI